VSDADRKRWEERYGAGAHDDTDPVALLEEALSFAPRAGRALDVACGRGRHAITLARRGYEVDALDISPAALASARERANDLPIRWRECDLDHAEIETGVYDIVVCVDFTDAGLVPRLLAALTAGGLLVFLARPRALCRFGPNPGETGRWFASLESLVHREDAERVEYVGRRP
jgi:SAM-dependent methyltransferase